MWNAPLIFLPVAMAATPSSSEAIRSMAGCFEVTFQYADREIMDPRYTENAVKNSSAIEWVVVDRERDGRIELQHVLVSGPAMIKHWRQIWTYEGTDVTQYLGEDQHKLQSLPGEAVAGQWTQVVTNVDDAPRYGCAGEWTEDSSGTQWRCTVDAPLPRREKDHRHEYDILERTNIHRIVSDGWDHDQTNTKIRIDDGKRVVMAREVGHNTYRRVDDEQCVEAIAWWPTEDEIWAEIRGAWSDVLGSSTVEGRALTVDEKKGLTPLWIDLFWLARRSAKRGRSTEDVRARAVKILEKHVSATGAGE